MASNNKQPPNNLDLYDSLDQTSLNQFEQYEQELAATDSKLEVSLDDDSNEVPVMFDQNKNHGGGFLSNYSPRKYVEGADDDKYKKKQLVLSGANKSNNPLAAKSPIPFKGDERDAWRRLNAIRLLIGPVELETKRLREKRCRQDLVSKGTRTPTDELDIFQIAANRTPTTESRGNDLFLVFLMTKMNENEYDYDEEDNDNELRCLVSKHLSEFLQVIGEDKETFVADRYLRVKEYLFGTGSPQLKGEAYRTYSESNYLRNLNALKSALETKETCIEGLNKIVKGKEKEVEELMIENGSLIEALEEKDDHLGELRQTIDQQSRQEVKELLLLLEEAVADNNRLKEEVATALITQGFLRKLNSD